MAREPKKYTRRQLNRLKHLDILYHQARSPLNPSPPTNDKQKRDRAYQSLRRLIINSKQLK